MDKAEYQVKLDELKGLVAEYDYEGALTIVEEIDWKRVKNIKTLYMVADVYEANDMLDDCKRILLLALKRASVGKSILSRLVELSLTMKDTAAASEYYQEFIKAAPRDAARYLLLYKIYRANQAPLEDQIEALRDYKDSEYTEKWAYELAYLYSRAGMEAECVEECDDIILWFSEGPYVVKAMELKMQYTELTASQQDKYDHRFETMPELLTPEEPRFPKKKKAEKAPEPEKEEKAAEETAEEAEVKAEPEPEPEPEPEEFVSTMDLQSRLSSELKKVIGGMLHDDVEESDPVEEEILAGVETNRYAPHLEPESLPAAGATREAVTTTPETKKEDGESTQGQEALDLSSIFEAQADAMAESHELVREEEIVPADPVKATADSEAEGEDFDLSGLLENEVADIMKEQAAEEAPVGETKDLSEIPEASTTREFVTEAPAEEKDDKEEAVAGDTPVAETEPAEETGAAAAETEAPAGEESAEDFDLQSILAAEVTGIMDESEKEEEPEEEKDLLTRLEEEADRTIEHAELVKETPQDKRLRIMRAAPANRMTEEQKRVFTYFAKVPGMDTQILEALNTAYNGAVTKTSRCGNILIMGRRGTGKTRLSEGLIKALCREFEMSAAKFARVLASDLNDKDVAKVVDKLSGGFLIIEKASRMTDETVASLNQAMEFRTDSMIVILEDEKDDMRKMLDQNPEFAAKFDAQIKIPVFTNDELVTFARTYAGECGYKMDEMGILALYTIIGANQSVEEPVSISKVKTMVDAAINKAGKGGRKFGRKLSGRQVDHLNRIILYEKDFEL